MKKVGIITFHFVENLGASLQCVALYKTLQKIGYDCRIINYRPRYHTKKYSIFYRPFSTITMQDSPRIKIKKTVKQILLNIKAPRNLKKKLAFKKFVESNIRLTKKYRSLAELKDTNLYLDVCIAGSDQIWNALYTEGHIDPAYLLTFFDGEKCTYAASAGTKIADGEIADNLESLKKIDNLSVREQSLHDQLLDYGIESAVVLDPALLLTSDDWDDLLEDKVDKSRNYVLVYALEYSSVLENCVNHIIKEKKIEIIDVSPRNFIPHVSGADIKRNRSCAPAMFVELIKKAQYVVTNSFHGTVFSIIYQVQFISVPHGKTPERVMDLLRALGLSDRLCDQKTGYNYIESIDYALVKAKLDELRNTSLEFLKSI